MVTGKGSGVAYARRAVARGKRKRLLVSALALAVGVAGPAWGYDYTLFNDPPPGEDSHLDIVSDIYSSYGGSFASDGNLGYVNAAEGITVKRVYDTNGPDMSLHILLGDETGVDQIWTDGTAMVTASAKFAALDQSFGWNQGEGVDGLDTSNYYQLLTEADIGGPSVDIMITGDFLWGIQPNGDEWWSYIDANSDTTDHLITYYVEGLPDAAGGEAIWLLFWEDLPSSTTDADYNDFVVELRAIPEPSAFLLVAGGLTALAAIRRRRSKA
jgi:hypothetical protein